MAPAGSFEPGREFIGGEDLRCAGQARELDGEKPDGARAVHTDAHSRLDLCQVCGVQGNTQRLEQRTLNVRDCLGNWEKGMARPGHVFA